MTTNTDTMAYIQVKVNNDETECLLSVIGNEEEPAYEIACLLMETIEKATKTDEEVDDETE